MKKIEKITVELQLTPEESETIVKIAASGDMDKMFMYGFLIGYGRALEYAKELISNNDKKSK